MNEQDAVALARKFHETYERLAKHFGYTTREDARQFDPDSVNGRLMIATCKEIMERGPVALAVQLALERAAKVLRKRLDGIYEEHSYQEEDTGAVVVERAYDGQSEILEEMEEAILALSSTAIADEARPVAQEAADLVVVPRYPTMGMMQAAWNAASVGRSPDEDRKVWNAMLNAAPVAQSEDDEARKMREDAERYRYMRNNGVFRDRNGPGLYWHLPRWIHGAAAEQLDTAIDEARKK